MEIITIETPALGDRSHVIIDGTSAAVVDPQRDIDRIESVLADRGVTVTLVVETHVHNDYVSGGYELARRAAAQHVLPADAQIEFDHIGAGEGDEFAVGEDVVLRAVHTPGHTPNHLSYVVVDEGRPVAVCTGGSLLYGSVGRTDLIDEHEAEALTRSQFQSVRRLVGELPGDTAVLPTHGFGSFCSSSATSGADSSTIDVEREKNVVFQVDDEDAFVTKILEGLTAYPRYYAHIAPRNRSGPEPVDLSAPEPVDATELRRRVHAGEWVVDLRDRKVFASKHLRGTVNVEVGDNFSTQLGWTIPWGTPVTLIGDSFDAVAEAQRQLVRIGIDRPAGEMSGEPLVSALAKDSVSYPSATFDDLADVVGQDNLRVLDVRRTDEFDSGHIGGAVNIPLHELESRLDELSAAQTYWVHCASGYRASVAASLVDRAGFDVIVVHDEWDNAPTSLLVKADENLSK